VKLLEIEGIGFKTREDWDLRKQRNLFRTSVFWLRIPEPRRLESKRDERRSGKANFEKSGISGMKRLFAAVSKKGKYSED
jgi:hypothetical protein